MRVPWMIDRMCRSRVCSLGRRIGLVPHRQLVQFWFFVKRGALDLLLLAENVLKFLLELLRCKAASDLRLEELKDRHAIAFNLGFPIICVK